MYEPGRAEVQKCSKHSLDVSGACGRPPIEEKSLLIGIYIPFWCQLVHNMSCFLWFGPSDQCIILVGTTVCITVASELHVSRSASVISCQVYCIYMLVSRGSPNQCSKFVHSFFSNINTEFLNVAQLIFFFPQLTFSTIQISQQRIMRSGCN